MSVQIDLNYRPGTYWPVSLDQEQLLSRIQGETRRSIARNILAEEGSAGLSAFFAQEALEEGDRRRWGLVHPQCMGGEYLPKLGTDDVEIARISLASATSDQVSIRASRSGSEIRYSVCDEYDTEFDLAFTSSTRPLSLGELIELINGSHHPEEPAAGGLLICHWESMNDWSCSPDESVAFARIQSAWYPELSVYYEQVADDWRREKRRKAGCEEDEEARA